MNNYFKTLIMCAFTSTPVVAQSGTFITPDTSEYTFYSFPTEIEPISIPQLNSVMSSNAHYELVVTHYMDPFKCWQCLHQTTDAASMQFHRQQPHKLCQICNRSVVGYKTHLIKEHSDDVIVRAFIASTPNTHLKHLALLGYAFYFCTECKTLISTQRQAKKHVNHGQTS